MSRNWKHGKSQEE